MLHPLYASIAILLFSSLSPGTEPRHLLSCIASYVPLSLPPRRALIRPCSRHRFRPMPGAASHHHHTAPARQPLPTPLRNINLRMPGSLLSLLILRIQLSQGASKKTAFNCIIQIVSPVASCHVYCHIHRLSLAAISSHRVSGPPGAGATAAGFVIPVAAPVLSAEDR